MRKYLGTTRVRQNSGRPGVFLPFGREHESAIEAEKCRKSLLYYTSKFWPVIDPGHEYIQTPLIESITTHLQAVTEGRILRLAMSLPPGHGKSLLTSVLWPSWEWSHTPNIQSIYFSYDPELATYDGSRCRMLIESDEWQAMFNPQWTFRPDQNQKTHYINTSMGSRYSFGLYSTKKTGRRADKMVIDDSLSIDDRFNADKKRKCIDIFNTVLQSRVHNPEKMKWVIVGHRLSDDDLIGYVTRNSSIEKWEYVKLPAEFNPEKRCQTSIGWTDWRTNPGELIFPELYNRDRIEIIKKNTPPDDYSALYGQEPVVEGGSRFKRSWIGRWEYTTEQKQFIRLIDPVTGNQDIVPLGRLSFFVSVDSAVGLDRTNDYSVYITWGVLPDGRAIILNVYKDRITEPESIDYAKSLMRHTRYAGRQISYFAVESNGVGKPLLQNMQRLKIPVVPIHVHIDKVAFATSAVVRYANGQIHHPISAEWVEDLENEMIAFPSAIHDDMVSALSIGAESLAMGVGNVQAAKSVVPERKSGAELVNTNAGRMDEHEQERTSIRPNSRGIMGLGGR